MTLDDILGQSHATRFLRGVLTSQRFPKAMVFHGPPGVGKGLAARTFGFEATHLGDLDLQEQSRLMLDAGDHPELNFYTPSDCYTEAELAKRKSEPTWKVGKIREFLKVLDEPVVFGARRTVVFEDFEKVPFGQASIPDAFLKILEDGVDNTTVILTTQDLDKLPGTLQARLTAVRFSRLTPTLVSSLLPSYGSEEHFELACRLGRGSVDETLDFLKPADGSLSGHDLRKRALTLLRLLHTTPGGRVLQFLSALPDQDAVKFFVVLKSVYTDLLLVESGIASGLSNEDCYEDLITIVENFEGTLAKGLISLRTLFDRMDRPGIRFTHQLKAAMLDLKIRTTPRPS